MHHVDNAQAQGTDLEREPRTNLLDLHLVAIVIEDVAMVADKDEVALIVKRDDSSALKLGALKERKSFRRGKRINEDEPLVPVVIEKQGSDQQYDQGERSCC